MGLNTFDRKFGADLVRKLPETPGVYLFKDEAGDVLYAGKAKNIRRRLASYRTVGRRKAQHKMRTLVREAHSIEVRLQRSERDALLVENELIRALRPRYNVDGAFDFLYASVGTAFSDGHLRLSFTTAPDEFSSLGLQWHGVFRSRARALDAFDALTSVFARVGHREPRAQLPDAPRLRGSRWAGFRRVPEAWLSPLRAFFDGESDAVLGLLFESLLERRDARRDASDVQASLRCLRAFYRRDISELRWARQLGGWQGDYVPSAARDALFIEARMRETESDEAGK